jgi:hypothetical protein
VLLLLLLTSAWLTMRRLLLLLLLWGLSLSCSCWLLWLLYSRGCCLLLLLLLTTLRCTCSYSSTGLLRSGFRSSWRCSSISPRRLSLLACRSWWYSCWFLLLLSTDMLLRCLRVNTSRQECKLSFCRGT